MNTENLTTDTTTGQLASTPADIEHIGNQVRETIRAQAPDLFRGVLPESLSSRIGSDYALGIHQQNGSGLRTAEEAAAFLNEGQGITTVNHGVGATLGHRFRIYGDTDLEPSGFPTDTSLGEALVYGYYSNPTNGRFVFAFPVTPEEAQEYSLPRRAVASTEYGLHLKEDGTVGYSDVFLSEQDGIPVNPKYCAAFIDNEGIVHPNADFMRENTFTPTTIEAM